MTRYLTILLCTITCSAFSQTSIDVDKEFAFAARQYEQMLKTHPDTTKFPQSTNPDGSIRDMKSDWWCSGFFGGSLWYLYEQTKDPAWKAAAQKWTMAVAKEQHNTGTHDLGFMLYCPFGNGYRLTNDAAYPPILLTGAKSLSTRFNPKIGLIKSWNKFKEYDYPVIIDNMMNLEFLFWAAKKSGNKQFRDICLTHADNTMKNHYRPDYSSFHVVCYNPDGTVAAKKTAQGYADNSAWARGQAWGLYGYTVMYRETKDKKYLDFARHIADFYLNHPNLPADKIPYWDFNAPGVDSPGIPNEERDASAGAIAASALLELSTYGGPAAKTYYQSAVQMLESLSSPAYKAKPGENNNFILMHSVGHKPSKSEVNTPIIYADYYYLEALLRYDALRKNKDKHKYTVRLSPSDPSTYSSKFQRILSGMKVARLLLLIVSTLILHHYEGIAQTDYLATAGALPNHPRILLLKGEEEAIERAVGANKIWGQTQQAILTECDAILDLPPVQRIQIGRRLLDKSREALRRIFFLSYAWRMTQQDKYLTRAETELLAVSAFSDWNPSHFLDVAEMTLGVSIGYDWLYNGLSDKSRSVIREAILKKGLEPSMDPQHNGWLKNANNWNQVCNAGMTYGALAIYEDQPELAKRVINRAIETVVLSMGEYRPDGAYPEGYSYWGYGTSFNVLLISALDKAFGQNFGLTQQPGFLKTAGYLENMTGPSGQAFNYSDSGLSGELQPAMFWFAAKQKDPSLLWVERTYLTNAADLKRQVKDRLMPATLIWGSQTNVSTIDEPKATMWVGAGKNPVAIMRTSWSDPNAIFTGLKTGSPGASHAHMDVGSFVMEADGVRWAMDFGMQQYESLESKGVDLWNMRQNSQRWQVFRYNNRVHNTLTVNDSLQRVGGSATITGSSNTPLFMNATTDLTAVYDGYLARANRGVALVDKAYVMVRDELETSSAEATVRWTMLTPATVNVLGGNKAELTKDGKKLILQVQEPANIVLTTWPTDPPHDYDAPNPGTVRVGFDIRMPANTKAALTVLLLPEKSAGTAKPSIKPLQQWPK